MRIGKERHNGIHCLVFGYDRLREVLYKNMSDEQFVATVDPL